MRHTVHATTLIHRLVWVQMAHFTIKSRDFYSINKHGVFAEM